MDTQAAEMMLRATGRRVTANWAGRVARLAAVLAEHPDAVVEECANERTGHRYGQRHCRRGRCMLLGHTCTDGRGSGYQLWAVWGGAQK